MLKSNKEFWRKKAQDENLMLENERKQEKEIEQNQLGWDRRYKEANWLLKGVTRIDDAAMGNLVEKVKKDQSKEIVMFKNQEANPNKVAPVAKKEEFSLTAYLKSFLPAPKEAPVSNGRFMDKKLAMKEKFADRMLEKEARKNRRMFLQEGAKRIRVLQQVGVQLKKPRQPAHTLPASELPDYEPNVQEMQVLDDYCEANLRNWTENRCVPAPVEILRSNAEVLAEEKERRTFKVSSRYHLHLGSEKLFPLKSHPITAHALYEAPHFHHYPEEQMLPDREGERRAREAEEARWAKENQPIYRLKKAKLNMSRQQYRRLPRPNTSPDMPSLTGGGSLMAGRSSGHVHSPNTRINQQFVYRRKELRDGAPSPPPRHHVEAVEPSVESESDRDSEEDKSQVTQDTAQLYKVNYDLTEDPASRFYNPQSRVKELRRRSAQSRRPHTGQGTGTGSEAGWGGQASLAPLTMAPTAGAVASAASQSMRASVHGGSSVGGFSQSGQWPQYGFGDQEGQSLALESSQFVSNGFQSDDAWRSNYLSEQSTNPGLQMTVKMARYRKMRKLDARRVKGGFHLISTKSKEHRLQDREEHARQRLKDQNEGYDDY